MRVIEVIAQGPQGPQGPSGPSGSSGTSIPFAYLSGSTFNTTSSIEITGSFKVLGSASITGSLFLIGQSSFVSSASYETNDFFLVRNSITTLKVTNGVQITSSANIPLQILNVNNNNLLQISQSGVVVFATSSVVLTSTAPNGGIYFTSNSFFIGLD